MLFCGLDEKEAMEFMSEDPLMHLEYIQKYFPYAIQSSLEYIEETTQEVSAWKESMVG